jgi:hypothetical protein
MSSFLQKASRHSAHMKEFESLAATLEKSTQQENYDLPRQSVTVTDISNMDFVGSGGTFIGTNAVRECLSVLRIHVECTVLSTLLNICTVFLVE